MRFSKAVILPLLIAASYTAHADLLGDTISVEYTAGAFVDDPQTCLPLRLVSCSLS